MPDGAGFPWTTFAINVTGSLALALLPALAVVRRRPVLAVALGPGVLGGYTTLSTYAEQGRALLADGRAGLAAAYLLGTWPPAWSRSPSPAGVLAAGQREFEPRRATSDAAAGGTRRGVGAAPRFWVAHHLDGRTPWGTLLVNVAGSFVLGLVVGTEMPRADALALLGTGFCGGLTTYSAFAVQTRDQTRDRGAGRRSGVRRRDDRPRARRLRAGFRYRVSPRPVRRRSSQTSLRTSRQVSSGAARLPQPAVGQA